MDECMERRVTRGNRVPEQRGGAGLNAIQKSSRPRTCASREAASVWYSVHSGSKITPGFARSSGHHNARNVHPAVQARRACERFLGPVGVVYRSAHVDGARARRLARNSNTKHKTPVRTNARAKSPPARRIALTDIKCPRVVERQSVGGAAKDDNIVTNNGRTVTAALADRHGSRVVLKVSTEQTQATEALGT